jgi:hypothetical protein
MHPTCQTAENGLAQNKFLEDPGSQGKINTDQLHSVSDLAGQEGDVKDENQILKQK